jgi:phospholipase/carboxylesterase
MTERRIESGGLHAIAIGDPDADLVAVVLHGREMSAMDLAPFAHSLGVAAYFVFPDAPLPAPRGHSWWPLDPEAHAQTAVGRPSDLFAFDPPGRAEARTKLDGICRSFAPGKHLALIGFSQGGMLAMDYALHGGRVDALALLSASRIAYDDWQPRLAALRDLPVLVAHGRDDDELAFSAGEALRDAALAGGARVEWLPFDGGHGIPLVVWRALRKFLHALDPP